LIDATIQRRNRKHKSTKDSIEALCSCNTDTIVFANEKQQLLSFPYHLAALFFVFRFLGHFFNHNGCNSYDRFSAILMRGIFGL